jgi:magnesium-transporting ATPase (P-type)
VIALRQEAEELELTYPVAAMAVSFGTMDWISGGVIAALVILNVSVGGYTEWQAEKVSLGISIVLSA